MIFMIAPWQNVFGRLKTDRNGRNPWEMGTGKWDRTEMGTEMGTRYFLFLESAVHGKAGQAYFLFFEGVGHDSGSCFEPH
jgi:hypothetical protein